jgi:hypothetical protein
MKQLFIIAIASFAVLGPFLCAEDKPCPQINTTTSDGDFVLKQSGGKVVAIDLTHRYRKPHSRSGYSGLVGSGPTAAPAHNGTVQIGPFYYDTVESCFYTTSIENGYGTLTSKSGRQFVATVGSSVWITVRGLKHHKEWTCHLQSFDKGTADFDEWKIGDVLWFNAHNVSKYDPSIPAAFEDCNDVSNLTQDYPSQVPK